MPDFPSPHPNLIANIRIWRTPAYMHAGTRCVCSVCKVLQYTVSLANSQYSQHVLLLMADLRATVYYDNTI
jgi:hypothetical protein